MWKLIFVALVALATAEKVKYNNYQVFRVTPQTEEQVEVIRNLEEISDGVCFNYYTFKKFNESKYKTQIFPSI